MENVKILKFSIDNVKYLWYNIITVKEIHNTIQERMYTMLKLYVAEDNAMNYMIIEDTENNTGCVFDWDLSDDEVQEITNKFESDNLTSDDFNGSEWKSMDEIFNNLFNIKLISYK